MPFCRCWDLNQSPLEEEPLLLTLELFFSSLHVFIISEKRSPNKARFIMAFSSLCPGLKFIREKKLQSLITNVNTNICCYQPPSSPSHGQPHLNSRWRIVCGPQQTGNINRGNSAYPLIKNDSCVSPASCLFLSHSVYEGDCHLLK